MFPAYDQYKSKAFNSPTSREPVMLALLNSHAAGHPDTGVSICALHEVMDTAETFLKSSVIPLVRGATTKKAGSAS